MWNNLYKYFLVRPSKDLVNTSRVLPQVQFLVTDRFSGGTLNMGLIVLGNGIVELSTNPGQSCLYFISHLCHWEKHKSYPVIGK